MSFFPKYVLKRIFPPDALCNVDYNGDGQADHWQVSAINVMMPFSVSELKAWNLNLEDVAQVYLNDEELDVKKFLAFYEGKQYDIASFYEDEDLIIPVGARAKVLYPKPGGLPLGLHVMKSRYSWEQFSGTIEIKLSITEERACVPFSPDFD